MPSACNSQGPGRASAIRAMAMVAATKAPAMTAMSRRKALARSPALASTSRRSTPSGVISVRTRWASSGSGVAVAAASALAKARPLPWPIEVDVPEHEHADGDGVSREVIGDQLAAEAFQKTGHEQHGHHAEHQGRGAAAGVLRGFHAPYVA